MKLVEELRTLIRDRGSIGEIERQIRIDQERADRLASVQRRAELMERIAAEKAKGALEIETRVAARDAAIRQLKETQQQLLITQRNHWNTVGPLERDLNLINRSLRLAVDPRIDEARRAMDHRLEEARRHGDFTMPVVDVPTGEYDSRTLGPITKRVSNEAARARLLAAIRTARAAFDALATEAPADLERAIGDILAPVNVAFAALSTYDSVRPAA